MGEQSGETQPLFLVVVVVAVVLDGRICRHDNRNSSGFCKGSLCPVQAAESGSQDER